jgi:phenylpropionate dioxygenase-like ring-hydroxylating dioxygenase large terminal subunit
MLGLTLVARGCRLAPLSEGRIEAGQLTCSYHGWRFNGEGQCTRVPQVGGCQLHLWSQYAFGEPFC